MKIFPILLTSILFFWTASSSAEEIILKVGETHLLKTSGRAWVEKSKVIEIAELPQGFRLKASRPGSTLFKANNKAYEIHVLSPSQERTWMRLDSALHRTLNLKMDVENGKIRILGKLLRWEDWESLYRACEDRDCEYGFQATISPELQIKVAKSISKLMMRNGFPPQNLLFERQVSALVAPKGDQTIRLTRALKSLGVQVINSQQSLDLAPLIKVQITVAEVKRNETQKYGIDWPNSYSAQIIPKFVQGTESQSITVHALETQGLAKVLASPTLLCRSGKSADFLAGGEFPIKLINFKTQDVIWKRYGILLKISPLADYSGKMSISIETEVSSIDTSHTVDGVPGLFTNRIQSHFDLSESRTIALSGLIKSEQGEASSGLPGLGRIPILGALFASKDFSENRTELVVFVKPEVVSPGTLEVDP